MYCYRQIDRRRQKKKASKNMLARRQRISQIAVGVGSSGGISFIGVVGDIGGVIGVIGSIGVLVSTEPDDGSATGTFVEVSSMSSL